MMKLLAKLFILILILILIYVAISFSNFITDHTTNSTYYFLKRGTKNQILATENLLYLYYNDVGHYPSNAQGLKVLFERPYGSDGVKWKGPYTKFKRLSIDAWENKLHYRCPGIHNPSSYDLWSNGANGKKGGTGKNADIGNW